MTIIRKQSKFSQLCLGKQQFKNNFTYRFLKYIIKLEIDDGILLYNNLTDELIFLDNKEFSEILAVKMKSSLYIELVQKWFLVEIHFDDYKLCNELWNLKGSFQQSGAGKMKSIEHYTILTTTDCNARCFYCYEKGRPKKYMSKATAEAVANYIANNSSDNINFRWFGGEPLYNTQAIDIICAKTKQNGIDFKSTIISNGYLLNEDILNKCKYLWNVKLVQITLDGPKEIYNKTKAYINDDINPFDTVIKNIQQLLKNRIKIKIRINVGMHNFDSLFTLIDFIEKRFGTDPNLNIYAQLLFEDTYSSLSNQAVYDRGQIEKNFNNIEKYIADKKLDIKYSLDGYVRFNQCMADNDKAVVISPEGNLGKCEHFSESEFFGSVYCDNIDFQIIEKFKRRKEPDTNCMDCQLYPNCIRLEMCPDIPRKCNEVNNRIYFQALQQRILNSYKDYSDRKKSND